jgi:hypothetical protein
MSDIQHCFICRPSDSTLSEDAGIEPRTVATTALAVRRSITTRLNLIHIETGLVDIVKFLSAYDISCLRSMYFHIQVVSWEVHLNSEHLYFCPM